MSTDRFDLLHDEWLADYLDSSTAYLKTACGIDVPVEPEVQAILDAWENGSDQEPWLDAQPGEDEEGAGSWEATSPEEGPAPTAWLGRSSSSEPSAA